jgi:hypothetical protein
MTTRRALWCFAFLAALTGVNCAPQADVPATRPELVPARPAKAEATIAPFPVAPAALKERIDTALDNVHHRDLLTTHAFWTVFHGILGMGPDTLLTDPDTGKRVNALDYICKGGTVRGMEFTPMGDGVDVVTMAGSGVGQGHQDQFIAELAQWGMPKDRKFVIAGKEYTYGDFVHHSKMRARLTAKQELSWAVLVVGEYYSTNLKWTNAAGETLTLEDVIRYELNEPMDTAACGGTHRLFDLTWVYSRHLLRDGGKKEGVWKDVADRLAFYKEQAHKFQNADGAFSSNYVSKPGHSEDSATRIATTGHVLEWLALTLTDRELTDPWVQEAANALALMILRHRSDPIDGGALYHAVHGLHIYRARVYHTPTPHLVIPPVPDK